MATIYVRSVPEELYQALKEQAETEHRSLNQHVIWLLQEKGERQAASPDALWSRIASRRARLAKSPRRFSDSAALLRKDRER